MYDIKTLFLLFLIYSFLGWLMETIYCSIGSKKFADRGFLIGPICPIYGCGAVAMTIFLKKYLDDPLVLFIMAVVICSILEYITSFIMEKIFNTRWWDYSNRLFNINGRVCLSNAVCFGALGIILLYFVNPFMISLLGKINEQVLSIICIIFLILLLLDYIFSTIIISKFTKTVKLVRKDSSNDINKKVRELLLSKSGFYKRLVKAFPNFSLSKK